jgi:uncharacterized protein involved in exopolysaccharide biosynthesis
MDSAEPRLIRQTDDQSGPPDLDQQPADGREAEPSLADLVNLIRRNLRLVGGVAIAACSCVVVIVLLLPRTYAASASLTPQSGEGRTSRLASYAAQFGLNFPLGDTGPTLGFYVDLLKSREILRPLVEARYEFLIDGKHYAGTLMDLYQVRGRTEALRQDAAMKRLKAAIDVSADPASGLVKLSVRSRWAPLSKRIAESMLELVNDFNLRRRQGQASAERRFVESRLEEAKAELDGAAKRLQVFLERNRDYRNSPLLVFQYDGFSRELSMRQQLYTSISQAYEQARIDEVRNTPVITTVERPELPAKPESKHLLLKGLVALFIGALVGLSGAFGREMRAGHKAEA